MQYVLAVELMCAAQALEFLKPLTPSASVVAAHELVRQHVAPLEGDRVLGGDIERLRDLVESGAFREVVSKFVAI